jgi:microcystin-dependent protein
MATPYLGEIRLVGLNFAPLGWSICNGSILPISENAALFDLLGTTYGGDGQTTFALPDLRGRAAMHIGSGYVLGTPVGTEDVTLSGANMPAHNHPLAVGSSVGNQINPAKNFPGVAAAGLGYVYESYSSNAGVTMNANSVVRAGSGQPHPNMQPSLVLNYIIALQGIFPSQN